MRIPNSKAISLCQDIVALADHADFYDGAVPTEIGDTPAGNVLLAFPSTTFGVPVDSNPGATATMQGTPTATGTAAAGAGTVPTFARILDSANNVLWDETDIGGVGSGSVIQMTDTSIEDGVEYQIQSWTVFQAETSP